MRRTDKLYINFKTAEKYLKNTIDGKIVIDKNILKYYSVDSSAYSINPKLVAIPKNQKDVVKIIKFAYKKNITVTCRGQVRV